MSLFNSIFGSSDEKREKLSSVNWIPLQLMGQLDEIIALSNEKPVLIFKHSTRCSISRFALKQFENEFDLHNQIDAYFLDLLEFRAISNEIASRFGIMHQSPQLLLIKEGKVLYDASHSDIQADELKKYI